MKILNTFLRCLIVVFCLAACEKEGDKIYLSSLEPGELIASENQVVLSQQAASRIVLSLAWTTDRPLVSDASMQAPNLVSTRMQVSTSADFAGTPLETTETSLSKAYTGSDLNTVAKNLGAEPGSATPLYFRLRWSTGNNIDPVYSQVATVTVTPYAIDMSIGYLLDAKEADTGFTLYSPASDGNYVGFMGATGWANFFLKEGDGTVWGNDGVDGSPFLLSSDATRWNCWFPGMGGCYYVQVETGRKQWSALWIPTLTVSGDLNGEMTFDRPGVKWTLPFQAAAAGTLTLQIAGTGKQYDYSTGTDDAAARDTPVGFAPSGDALTLGEQASSLTVSVPAAGEYTLVVDLSHPQQWTARAVSGTETPAEVPTQIFLSGIDDLVSGGWNFNTKLPLYDEDNLAYAGVAYAASEWGYNVFTEADNWEDKYTFGSGDALEGTMEFKGEGGNLPAPAEGLYFFDVSLKALTYKLTMLTDVIYYAGLNDDWDFHPLEATRTAGVYAATVTIDKPSEWGFKLYLWEGNWDEFYGGGNGALSYKADGITDDATLPAGTYTLTVDLPGGTYALK